MIRAFTLKLLVGALLLTSCSDSPTGPDAGPLVFQGTVVALGSTSHNLTVTDYGGVRIQLDDLTPRLIEGTSTELSIGFGLGQLDGETCVTTFQVQMIEGDALVFSLGNEQYCLLMYDSGLLPADAVVEYTLVVTP